MYFNPTTNSQSIVARMNRTTHANNTTYPLIDKANDCNEALDRFLFLAMTADGKWQVDDSNNTDLPVAYTDLVSGQRDYSIAASMIMIEKVVIKDSSGNKKIIKPVDISQSDSNFLAKNIVETPSGDSGIPVAYDKAYNSIILSPIPNYSYTGGLIVHYKRGPNYFTSTDTTKEPGIPSIFHSYIAHYASYLWLVDKDQQRAARIYDLVLRDEQAITEFYSKRNVDDKIIISGKFTSGR